MNLDLLGAVMRGDFVIEEFKEYRRLEDSDADAHCSRLLESARNRAKKKQINFNISVCDIKNVWASQGGRCSITGLPFFWKDTASGSNYNNSFQPSLDRIIDGLGYEPSNIQLTTLMANFGKNRFGADLFQGMVSGAFVYHLAQAPLANFANVIDHLIRFWMIRHPIELANVYYEMKVSGDLEQERKAEEFLRVLAGIMREYRQSPRGE